MDELYGKPIFYSYHGFQNTCQDILETNASYKFIFIPLNINLNLCCDNNQDKLERKNTSIGERLNY